MAYATETGRAVAGVGTGPFEAVRRAIAAAYRRYRRYRDFVDAEYQLGSMSDHQLADIGLSRGEIKARVWANY